MADRDDDIASLSADGRPEFLVVLGLLLPCGPEDVEQAYRAKSKSAHPDAGGSHEEFVKLNRAYEQAKEYAQFFASRRKWIGAAVDRYIRQETLLAELTRKGGAYELEPLAWLRGEVGDDFAQLLDRVVTIRWTGSKVGDDQLQWLASHQEELSELRTLDLAGSRVSDRGLQSLLSLAELARLNLRDSAISSHGLVSLAALPNLESIDARGIDLGWLGLRRARGALEDVELLHD